MQEIIDKFIILKADDGKEKNKSLTLFGLECGIIKANCKGVKGANAKLKFLSLPFCFCEISLLKRGSFFTVKTASLIEGFSGIYKNYEKIKEASVCAEIILICGEKNEPQPKLFLSLINSLKEISKEENESVSSIKFIMQALEESGYRISLENCRTCDNKFNKTFLNLLSGEIVCEVCAGENCQQVKADTIKTLNIIYNNEKINLSQQSIINAKTLLKHVVYAIYEVKMKTI